MIILDSIIEKKRKYQIEHYKTTKYGTALATFHNKHNGRCFIIGNGPSLTAEDLTVLHNYNECTFAFNRVYLIFKQTEWRPTYYMSQDKWILSNSVKEANEVKAQAKFIPIELKWYDKIYIKNAYYYHLVNRGDNTGFPDFSEQVDQFIANSATVVYSAIQMAVYMGFKEIYLIGVDQHFHISKNAKGKIIIDPTAKDYFCNNYNADKDKLAIPATETSYLAFLAAKNYADTHGVRIYNATRGGKLEVFQRLEFDSLF